MRHQDSADVGGSPAGRAWMSASLAAGSFSCCSARGWAREKVRRSRETKARCWSTTRATAPTASAATAPPASASSAGRPRGATACTCAAL